MASTKDPKWIRSLRKSTRRDHSALQHSEVREQRGNQPRVACQWDGRETRELHLRGHENNPGHKGNAAKHLNVNLTLRLDHWLSHKKRLCRVLQTTAFWSGFERDQEWQLETDHRQLKFFCEREECDELLHGNYIYIKTCEMEEREGRLLGRQWQPVEDLSIPLQFSQFTWKQAHRLLVRERGVQTAVWGEDWRTAAVLGCVVQGKLDWTRLQSCQYHETREGQRRYRSTTGNEGCRGPGGERDNHRGNMLEMELFSSLLLQLVSPMSFQIDCLEQHKWIPHRHVKLNTSFPQNFTALKSSSSVLPQPEA